MAGGFAVDVAELYGLAETLSGQAQFTGDAASVVMAGSGNGQVDAALSQLAGRWSAQTQALGGLVTSLALAIGAAAIDYTQTDQQTAAGFK